MAHGAADGLAVSLALAASGDGPATAAGQPAVDALMWAVALVVLAMLVTALVSLSRSPLEPARRIPWAFALFLLPVIGPAVWLWWRFSYFPQRKAEQPHWDPNRREVIVNPPRRPGT